MFGIVRAVTAFPDFQERIFVRPTDGESGARIHWSVVARDALVLGLRYERTRKIFNRLAPRTQAAICQPLELLATVGFVDLVELVRLGIEIK
jgi:hypothetical protein